MKASPVSIFAAAPKPPPCVVFSADRHVQGLGEPPHAAVMRLAEAATSAPLHEAA